MDRTERQNLCIQRWVKAGGKASIVAATGTGKTRISLMLIQKLIKKSPKLFILIVVPTEFLKEQWTTQLIQWNLINNCQIVIINSVVKKDWNCNLLIIDECHLAASEQHQQVFEKVHYDMLLCLTATLQRLDGGESIIKKYAPVCDTITLDEALKNGWISPVREYAVLLDVDLTEYKKYDRCFNGYFAYFNFDFNVAMKCCTDWTYRTTYAKKMRLPVKEVLAMSMDWMRYMRKRKEFIMSHPKKAEVCKKILAARTDKKCITFSATIKDSEALGVGEVLHSKQSKKHNKEVLDRFNAAKTGVLCTNKACDQGVDVPGLNVGIIMSIDSSKIRKTQRVGRICRFEEGKIAELFTLIIKGTQEWKWFQNSNTSSNVSIINEEQLDQVLKGEIINTRQREQIEDVKFRF